MGMTNTAFDLGKEGSQQRLLQQRQINEQQRVQQQNVVGAQLLDAINNASNIKPTVKDPTSGADIPNPAYAKAQKDKQDLIAQHLSLFTPQQHATFADRLHGLIFGHPTDNTQQPALSPDNPSAPLPASATPPNGAATPPVAAPPPHPFEKGNPVLDKISEGIQGLKNHLSAAANPLPPPANQPNAATIAQYYRDPGEVAAERTKDIWGVRGQNALDLQEKKNEYLKAMLQARPPRLLSQTTIPDLLEQMKVDPTMSIYGPNGNELSPAQLAEMPPGTVAREFRAGTQIFYALGDQNSKTLNVGGQIYQIPAIGEITSGNANPLGAATSTLPKTHTNATTDPFGLTTHSASTSQTATTPGITAAPPTAPGTPPELQRRPVSSAAPTLPPSATPPSVNTGARAPGTKPAGGAVKTKPVSSAAPSLPPSSLPPLDADGHIPNGVGNDLVRQYANNLMDGQDSAKIPNPRARAAAEVLASQYGWSQGAFTPKEKIQFKVATDFLSQLQKSDALSVLDSVTSREKIAHAMKDPQHMTLLDRIIAYNLTPKEAEFIRLQNAARGTVAGLSTITRSGRATNSQVNTIATELPNVFQSSSAADAKDRIDQLLKEANTALSTNPMTVGKGGPVSANAPKSPGAGPKENDTKVNSAGDKVVFKGGKWGPA